MLMRKRAPAPATNAEPQPLDIAAKAGAGKPLSNDRLARAAALLDEIDRLGKELWAIMDADDAYHSVNTPVGRVLLYVEEGLAVNAQTHITPGELAARLRALIPPR